MKWSYGGGGSPQHEELYLRLAALGRLKSTSLDASGMQGQRGSAAQISKWTGAMEANGRWEAPSPPTPGENHIPNPSYTGH